MTQFDGTIALSIDIAGVAQAIKLKPTIARANAGHTQSDRIRIIVQIGRGLVPKRSRMCPDFIELDTVSVARDTVVIITGNYCPKRMADRINLDETSEDAGDMLADFFSC